MPRTVNGTGHRAGKESTNELVQDTACRTHDALGGTNNRRHYAADAQVAKAWPKSLRNPPPSLAPSSPSHTALAEMIRAVSRPDGLTATGSDGLADTGSDGLADTGAISVADRRADEGAHHRPHRRDAVKCTYTRSEPARCT